MPRIRPAVDAALHVPGLQRGVPPIRADELTKIREEMKLARSLFARYLRANVRTLENWEQGRAKPNAQAALLMRLAQRYPIPYGTPRSRLARSLLLPPDYYDDYFRGGA